MQELLDAITDPTRREIVAMLTGGERTAGEIATHFLTSRPGVSRHLRVLHEAGLVTVRRDAQRRIYALDATPLVTLDTWLEPYRRFWEQRLDALDTEVARGKRERSRSGASATLGA